MRKFAPYCLSAPAMALVLGLVGGPLVLLFRMSFYEPSPGQGFYAPGSWTLANFKEAFQNPKLQILGYTLIFGMVISTSTLLIAYPFAWWLRSQAKITQRILLGIVFLPKFGSVLALLFGLQQSLSNNGLVNQGLLKLGWIGQPLPLLRNHFGAWIGELFLILPYAIFILYLQFLRMDRSLEQAARGLGASPWQVFRAITFPLSLPGVILAGQLSLMWGMGAYLGPYHLGGPEQFTLSVEVHRQALEYSQWPLAAAFAVILLLSMGGMIWIYSRAMRFILRRK